MGPSSQPNIHTLMPSKATSTLAGIGHVPRGVECEGDMLWLINAILLLSITPGGRVALFASPAIRCCQPLPNTSPKNRSDFHFRSCAQFYLYHNAQFLKIERPAQADDIRACAQSREIPSHADCTTIVEGNIIMWY